MKNLKDLDIVSTKLDCIECILLKMSVKDSHDHESYLVLREELQTKMFSLNDIFESLPHPVTDGMRDKFVRMRDCCGVVISQSVEYLNTRKAPKKMLDCLSESIDLCNEISDDVRRMNGGTV